MSSSFNKKSDFNAGTTAKYEEYKTTTKYEEANPPAAYSFGSNINHTSPHRETYETDNYGLNRDNNQNAYSSSYNEYYSSYNTNYDSSKGEYAPTY